jgi:L-cysteine S-thiosulfotransferase
MTQRAGLGASVLAGLSALLLSACATPASPQAGAGDTMTQPLTATPGDAARGRAIVANRQVGLCLLCHTGAGSRWSEGQLRLRISDARRVNPGSIMPAYHAAAADPAARVASGWKDRPILDAQQIEDVVAFLSTLRE